MIGHDFDGSVELNQSLFGKTELREGNGPSRERLGAILRVGLDRGFEEIQRGGSVVQRAEVVSDFQIAGAAIVVKTSCEKEGDQIAS